MVLLYLFFRFTRVGIAMQAASQNKTAATLVGISVPGVNSLVWALGAGMAGVAGILIAPITFVYPGVGYVGLLAFPAAVLGGFGSLPGAFVGGIVIGLLEVFSGFYLSEWVRNAAPYMALLAVLFIRPSGLFGVRLQKKV
jgi:branched-chain amino acid transport system permease protein